MGKAHMSMEGKQLADKAAKEASCEPEVTVVTSGGIGAWDIA